MKKILTLFLLIINYLSYSQTYFLQRNLQIAEIEPTINTIQTNITTLSDDNYAGPFDIGFNFKFYENSYNEFYISSNGFISFGAGFSNQAFPVPHTNPPNNLIAFAGADLYVNADGIQSIVNYFISGESPNRVLVINFKNVPLYSARSNKIFTQIQLYEGNEGKIEIHNTVNDQKDEYSRIIGVENINGTIATKVTNPVVSINEMIRFLYCNNNPAISTTSNLICPPNTSVTLNGSCANGNLLWSNGQTTPSINANSAGTFSVSCSTNTCSTSTSTIVENFGTPYIYGKSGFCEYSYADLHIGISFNNARYQWKFNGVNIPNEINENYNTNLAGIYNCQIDYKTCSYVTNSFEVVDATPPKPIFKTTTFKFAWDKSFGGSTGSTNGNSWQNWASGALSLKTLDGNIILAGTSNSNFGNDKSQNSIGNSDFWVIKTDSNGNKIWDKTYGTIKWDIIKFLIPISDGGFLIGGYFSTSEQSLFNTKWYLFKIDSDGNKIWEKTFGTSDGAGENILYTAIETADSGFLLGGISSGNISGDKSETGYGNFDFWIIKTDNNGNKIWDKVYGGNNSDVINNILKTTDGGYLLGGTSHSGISGVKSSAKKGWSDYWIIKINSTGTIIWDMSYGGGNGLYDYRQELTSMINAPDNSYILGGNSTSPASGDKSENGYGYNDFWVIKINNIGVKQWDRTIGRADQDYLKTILLSSDSSLLLAGNTSEITTLGENFSVDFWVVKLSLLGVKLWEKRVGGNNADYLNSIIQSDNGIILSGSSSSIISREKSVQPKGVIDYWMIKVKEISDKDVVYLTSNERFSTEITVNNCPSTIFSNLPFRGKTALISTNTGYSSYPVSCYNGCISKNSYITITSCLQNINIADYTLGLTPPLILDIRAAEKIFSNNKIVNGNINYSAGNAIFLNPGFETKSVNIFKAEIKNSPCN